MITQTCFRISNALSDRPVLIVKRDQLLISVKLGSLSLVLRPVLRLSPPGHLQGRPTLPHGQRSAEEGYDGGGPQAVHRSPGKPAFRGSRCPFFFWFIGDELNWFVFCDNRVDPDP